jgi:uncharacterized glyoxalase superfamily protein PhnB
MTEEFPAAVPEMPVSNVDDAAAYYESRFGFSKDWGDQDGGIAQVSKGSCRLFLTSRAFRVGHGNTTPLVIWLNLNSKQEVDELYETWSRRQARIVSKPESKPWNLHEFTAADQDGNMFRVFYDFNWELADSGV